MTLTEPPISVSESAWLVAAQGLSSLSNFGINIVALLILEPVEFGAFSVAILGYRLALALTRSLVVEPILTDEKVESLLGGLPVVVLAWGVLLFSPALIVAVVASGPLRGVALALTVLGPMLLTEEAIRQVLVARGLVRQACVTEGVWVVGGVAAVSLLLLTDSFGPTMSFIAWAGAGTAAAIVGRLLSPERPEPHQGLACVQTVRASFGLLVGMTAATRGATQISIALVGIVLGLDGFARLRGAQALVSPASVLVQGARLSSFKSSATADEQIGRTRRVHSLALVGTLLWTLMVVVALPFLDPWFDATQVSAWAVPFEGLTIAFVILAAGSELTYRFRREYQQLLKRSVMWIPFPLVLAPTGALWLGPPGAAAATALALGVRVLLLGRPRLPESAPAKNNNAHDR